MLRPSGMLSVFLLSLIPAIPTIGSFCILRLNLLILRACLAWNSIFLFAIWYIWIDHNQRLFDHNSNSSLPSPNTIANNTIRNKALEWYSIVPQQVNSHLRDILVGWTSPREFFVKLNTDGAFELSTGKRQEDYFEINMADG